jgi:hypothetical protein
MGVVKAIELLYRVPTRLIIIRPTGIEIISVVTIWPMRSQSAMPET